MADITINSSDTDKIDVDVSDSNNLNLKLTGGDKGLRLHMLETIYPVGSIYINAGVATNPGTLLGFGTWTAFGTGRTIVGVDSSDTDFDAVRETGGAKTHTLTIAEMPSHNHPRATSTSDDFGAGGTHGYIGGDQASSNVDTSMALQGGGQAHNNLQPYITAYMWRRTA